MAARGRTLSETVYAAVRADILAGRLAPGARLPFGEMCARYGSSTGVLREGLSRLVEQGLVRAEPQQGVRVSPLSHSDLAELTEARVAVETLVLRGAVEHGGLPWESQVIAAHHTLARTPPAEDADTARFADAWTAAHAAYHAALLAGCPNGRLRSIALGLRDSAELYRQWSRPLGEGAGRDIANEHRVLLDAVLARDVEGAATALAEHISTTSALLLETAEHSSPPGPREAGGGRGGAGSRAS